MRVRILFVAICLLLVSPKANAQDWEIGALLGASGYMGDLNPENPFAYNDWGAGLSGKYNLNSTWGVRANFSYSRIHADDRHSSVVQRQIRGLNFAGYVAEAAVLVDFNFFRFLPQRGRNSYTPYLFAGVGGIHFYPKWSDLSGGGEWNEATLGEIREAINDDPDGTEDIRKPTRYAIAIPFGAGFKYNLRGPWTVGVEVGYRQAFTDYLDAVSGSRPQESKRWLQGDGRPNDSYMTAGFTISYTIFKGGCPEWRN